MLDSNNVEMAAQEADMLARMGRKAAIIDVMGVLRDGCPHKLSLNPFNAAATVSRYQPEDQIYAIDNITNSLSPKPSKPDERNRNFREWPRNIIEFPLLVLLKRSTTLAIPDGAWRC
ncbi:hypothetical protein [Hoeflea alexandrii]|uniref:hypothetical protein n=1 Tax=Hoeflea alexandrii TaxID=288436 RepID=UPI0022B06898|nr:hypothetical protein [Hoeflea alexandrii]MCZ4287636.1 hypothetical protein [Hoeflea alexandrii]